MLTIRLYLSVLTFAFLVLVTTHRGVGVLEAIVVTCSVLYLILDARVDLQALKVELEDLKQLEQTLLRLP